ncbi:hypothetical protein NIES37_38470 [Tolypothrix tenuis PCC 7101]|uniref:Uncharacterized protein n=1 Tax=Tolypothrix tenuis PCC 7101 TaxID=231146 RepID=A0A1Z4N2D7_9CYAN|nr:hypothetical protein [Aulosira sp. FACHB-113]BAY99864.1 hypothetical protein NIES37_38470 [Tolypothrix tenuis PCC 7101]BAZ76214.1 hypothetical protein NIES50_48120 [Aulosira laxa NIES-50]
MDSNRTPNKKKAELIEQHTKTFGIEIEFCTHKSAILSYTHIEVCKIKDGVHEWKIETDADFTLELVSPILVFDNHEAANECKRILVKELHEIVKSRPTLKVCIDNIQVLIKKISSMFRYWNIDHAQEYQPTNAFKIEYITREQLLKELDFHNWDISTKWQEAEDEKKKFLRITQQDLENYINTLKLRVSQKHGGMPSPQLNLPMSLKAYVWYSAYVKEPTAWRRLLLLSNNDFKAEWVKKRIQKISGFEATVTDSEMNKDFTVKVTDWFKYWFWLVSIRELTEKALQSLKYKDGYEWRENLGSRKGNTINKHQLVKEWQHITLAEFESRIGITNKGNYKGLPIEIVKKIGNNGMLPVEHYWELKENSEENSEEESKEESEEKLEKKLKENKAKSVVSSLLYLIVQKLIAGALGVLSEPAQLKFQELKCDPNNAKKSNDILLRDVPNANFRDYHSFLKDLTPLWFKGTLADVLLSVLNSSDTDLTNLVLPYLIDGIKAINRDVAKKILENNIAFLETMYSFHQLEKNSKNWKSFQQEFVPSLEEFLKQYEIGRVDLLRHIGESENNIWQLDRFGYDGNLETKDNKFLQRNGVPPWEGRWDTLKPPIDNLTEEKEFLVEHRNN